MSHFKARNSSYPSFDRLPSEIPNSYKMHGAYEQFQLSGEFELECLACEQARLHFECDCRETTLAVLHLHISFLVPITHDFSQWASSQATVRGNQRPFFCKITVRRSKYSEKFLELEKGLKSLDNCKSYSKKVFGDFHIFFPRYCHHY